MGEAARARGITDELRARIDRFNRIPGKLLTFDLTNACNLGCFYCTWTQDPKHKDQPNQSIALADIQRVVGELLAHGSFFETICLSVSGEPTMNQEFDAIIDFLFETNGSHNRLFRNISINSNATSLTAPRMDNINRHIAAGRGYLHLTLSINAGSRESFLASKKADLFERTVEHTLYILSEKKRLGFTYQQVLYLQFLVQEMIEHEAEEFREFWVGHLTRLGLEHKIDYAMPVADGDTILIFKRIYADSTLFTLSQQQYDDMHRSVAERLGIKPDVPVSDLMKHVPSFEKAPRKVCGSPFLSPIVRRDGTLNFCLTDDEDKMPIGNVFRDGFFALWLSPVAEEFRRRHVENCFTDGDLCRECNYFDGVSIPAQIADEYRRG